MLGNLCNSCCAALLCVCGYGGGGGGGGGMGRLGEEIGEEDVDMHVSYTG